MDHTFEPKIDRKKFVEAILHHLNNEGGDPELSNRIVSAISRRRISDTYDAFFQLCRQYHLELRCTELQSGGKPLFKIAIELFGQEDHVMDYRNRDLNITFELAGILLDSLAVQINNQLFVNKVKS